MSQWQPIETAPKDQKILLGRFVKGDEHDGYISVDRWRSRETGSSYEGFGQFNERYWPATHWMPLQPPPS